MRLLPEGVRVFGPDVPVPAGVGPSSADTQLTQ